MFLLTQSYQIFGKETAVKPLPFPSHLIRRGIEGEVVFIVFIALTKLITEV